MKIEAIVNWNGIEFLIHDDGNDDMSHFRIQTDSKKAIVKIQNTHTRFMATVVEQQSQLGDWVKYVETFRGSKPDYRGFATTFSEDILDASCKAAIDLLRAQHPDIRYYADVYAVGGAA